LQQRSHTLAEWFNTADFQTNPSLVATTGQARVFPNEIDGNGGCRGDSLKVANASAQRDFRFREKATFQFRFDVYNITNHSEFGLPNTTPTSAQFGQITTTIAGGGGSPTLNRSAAGGWPALMVTYVTTVLFPGGIFAG